MKNALSEEEQKVLNAMTGSYLSKPLVTEDTDIELLKEEIRKEIEEELRVKIRAEFENEIRSWT